MGLKLVFLLAVIFLVVIPLPNEAADQGAAQAKIRNIAPIIILIKFCSTEPMTNLNFISSCTDTIDLIPTSGGNTNFWAATSVLDINGHNDISNVDMNLYYPNGLIHTAAGVATKFDNLGRTIGYYKKQISLRYFDYSDTSAPGYNISITATDIGSLSDIDSNSGITYQELTSLNIETPTMMFNDGNEIEPEQNSSIFNQLIDNYGNVEIDLYLKGSNLTYNTNVIDVQSIYYGETDSVPNVLTDTDAFISYNLASGESSKDDMNFLISIPEGTAPTSGVDYYQGTIWFTAAKS